MRQRDGLNKRAMRRSLWHVDNGWAVFAGPLNHNAPHAHSTAVYLAGLYGTFRLRVAGGNWVACRSAVIRAGTAYEFDIGGDPLGVLYLEPSFGGADALVPFASEADEIGGALFAQADNSPLRSYFERRAVDVDSRPEMEQVLSHARLRARRGLDPRIVRAVSLLQEAGDASSVAKVAQLAGLSPSRFQHLFTQQVGVPFRRYRGWQRLRRAIREAATGTSLTDAAHAAGFADQAHFSRAFRATFGAPPSVGL